MDEFSIIHLGYLKTYHCKKKDLFWVGVIGDVKKFMVECLICQQNKGEMVMTPSLDYKIIRNSNTTLEGNISGLHYRVFQII